MTRYLAAICALIVAGLVAIGPAHAETRVALIIGNSGYQQTSRLTNPERDAQTIAAALRQVGFSTVELRRDLDKTGMELALKQFAQRARQAEVAVIYYAGHGVELGGVNYLVPTDAVLAADGDIEFEAVPLGLLERSVQGASRLKLIILDACRNNPFLTTMQRTRGVRAVGRGLARVEPEGDTLIAYAAREGSVASDGEGANSPFTASLARQITTPGVEIRLLFGRVRDDVLKATGRVQEPAIYGSMGGEPFYFLPPTGAASTTTAAAGAPDPQTLELAFWQSASGADDPDQLRAYLDRYPRGVFAALAETKIAALTRNAAPAPSSNLERAHIGATVQTFTADMAAAQGLGRQTGAIVTALGPAGPAAQAGVEVGDIIIAINRASVDSSAASTRIVAAARPGDVLALQIIRQGQQRMIQVRLGVRPADLARPAASEGVPLTATVATVQVLGMTLSEVDDQARAGRQLPSTLAGALVEAVDPGSQASTRGLRPGDVIVLANGKGFRDAAGLAAVVEASRQVGRTSVLLGVYRNNRTVFLPLNVQSARVPGAAFGGAVRR